MDVGVNDTGHDVKFFGATAGAYMLWDESQDDLIIGGGGRLGIGTTAPSVLFHMMEEGGNCELSLRTFSDTEAHSNYISFFKADGTAGSPGLVDDDSIIGGLSFQAYDGSNYHESAAIKAQINGTPSDGTDMPTELLFSTANEAEGSPTTRMVIAPSGNIGIGTPAPSDKLDVNGGSIRLDNTYGLRWGADKAGIYGNGETSGGFMRFVVDDVERIRIIEDGKVGIGETAPACFLTVGAQTGSDLNTTAHAMFIAANQTLTGGGSGQVCVQASTYGQDVGGMVGFSIHRQTSLASPLVGAVIAGRKENNTNADYATYLHFGTRANGSAPAERMRITSAGNVGSGTSVPLKPLHVKTNNLTTVDPALRLENSGTGSTLEDTFSVIQFAVGDDTAGPSESGHIGAGQVGESSTWINDSRMMFWVGNTGPSVSNAKMTIVGNNGYVGIGTETPINLLHLAMADTSSTYLQFSNSTTGHSGTDGFYIGVNGGGTAAVNLWNAENTNIRFATNNLERMTITSAGDVRYMGVASGKMMAIVTGASTTNTAHTKDFTLHANVKAVEVMAIESTTSGNWHSFAYSVVACDSSGTGTTESAIANYGVEGQSGLRPTFSKTSSTNFRVSFNAGTGSDLASEYYIRAILIGD